MVRERLYRDGVERAISRAGNVRWVPPPIGGSYHGFRITLQPAGSRPKSSGDPDEGGRLPRMTGVAVEDIKRGSGSGDPGAR